MNLREKLKKLIKKYDNKHKNSMQTYLDGYYQGGANALRDVLSLLDEHPLLEDVVEYANQGNNKIIDQCKWCKEIYVQASPLCEAICPSDLDIPAIASKLKEYREGK